MTTPIAEPTLGQPGWNQAFKAVLQRVNALESLAISAVADALIGGTNISISHNEASGSITINAGGAAALDTEALMDYLAANLVPGTDLGLTYDDEAGQIILNYTGTPTAPGATGSGDPAPALHDMVSWTIDPASAGSSTAPTVGELCLLKLALPAPATIASALLQVATAGSGLSNCFVGIVDMTGARRAVSADQSTAFQSGGAKEVAFVTPAELEAGEYYVVILIGGGTSPALSRGASATVTNLGTTAGGFRSCTSGAGQTAIPTTVTLSSTTANNTAWCVGLRST